MDNKANRYIISTLLFFLIILSSCQDVFSIPYNIRVLNAVYPSSSIEQKCMLIDKQGLIWLGTIGRSSRMTDIDSPLSAVMPSRLMSCLTIRCFP